MDKQKTRNTLLQLELLDFLATGALFLTITLTVVQFMLSAPIGASLTLGLAALSGFGKLLIEWRSQKIRGTYLKWQRDMYLSYLTHIQEKLGEVGKLLTVDKSDVSPARMQEIDTILNKLQGYCFEQGYGEARTQIFEAWGSVGDADKTGLSILEAVVFHGQITAVRTWHFIDAEKLRVSISL